MDIIYIASAKSIHTVRWIKFFAINNQITWINTGNPTNETINEFKELKNSVKIYNLNNIFDLNKIIYILLFKKYNLVHLHYLGWHSLLTIFMRPKSNLLITPWGSDLLINRSFLKRVWLSTLMKKAKYIICDSDRLKIASIKLGAKMNNISVIMFGIDTNVYKCSRRIFSNENKIFIGSNRKLEPIYDIFTFLEAAKIICKKRNNIYFLIAGNGSLNNKVLEFIKKENLRKKIRLLGLLNKKQMIDFYNKIDIYVSTALSDGGLSSSTAEAMAFERLIIITNNSDNDLWVKNSKNGYLFENKNYEELAKKIDFITQNKSKNLLIACNARSIIDEKYSYKKEMNRVQKIYNKFD